MRKLWVKAWMTLDGVFDADTMDHWWPPKGEAAADYARRIEYIAEEYSKGDMYLLGRTTYEMLWPGWSTQTDTLGSILNRMQKYVVSTTLETAPWKDSTIIRGNAVEEITKLKQQPGRDMIIDGSATLVQSLMGTDLIDEYRFLVVPYPRHAQCVRLSVIETAGCVSSSKQLSLKGEKLKCLKKRSEKLNGRVVRRSRRNRFSDALIRQRDKEMPALDRRQRQAGEKIGRARMNQA